MDTAKSHEKFLAELDYSHAAVWRVAMWLWSHGHKITIPPTTTAPTFEQRHYYTDGGDLYMDGKRIEVKNVTQNFTGEHDWPFRDFIVNGKETHDKSHPPPKAYVIVSQDMQHVGIVRGDTRECWRVSRRIDGRRGVEKDFYVVGLDKVVWRAM